MSVHRFIILFFFIAIIPVSGFADTDLKIRNEWVNRGEILNYKANWGFLTIGSATTKINKVLYKVGADICYKVEINGQTNGIAKLFYVQDSWTSYIDTSSMTTHKCSRRIREGRYELDEQVRFDHKNKKAVVEVLNKETKQFKLKKIYDTPQNIRDVIAGFMVFQLVDLSDYKIGEVFSVNGFYEDEGYNIAVKYVGNELLDTDKGKQLCYKVVPTLPKNKVFNGSNAIEVWLSVNSHNIVRISAKMFVGHIIIDLKK